MRLLCFLYAALAFAQPDASYFDTSVKPILRANCYACHTDKSLTSGLSLQTRESILRGGNRGNATETLLGAVRHSADLKMPPGRKLTPEQIAVIEKWVADGLPMPDNLLKSKRPGSDHWSFQAPVKAALPNVSDNTWPKTALDNFILARLDAAKLKPSPEAPRSTLLRRVHLDITGLPPTAEETAAFLADKRPDAYEQVVDRLLASPHYGERWGRHWLDQARYADSDGYTIDAPRDIWKFRDWVIASLNSDMPFDRFTVEQIAGDLLPNPTNDQLIATGFHRNTTSNFEGGIDFEQYRVEAVADRVATTGAVWMGLTLGCARCHDHKYDPISQREFYQLFAFYNNTTEIDKEAERNQFNRPFLELPTDTESAKRAAHQAQLAALKAELEQYKKTDAPKAGDPALDERIKNVRELEKRAPKITSTLIVRETEKPREAYIHLGGDFLRKGVSVQPGVPAVMPGLPTGGPANRLDLARWLVDRKNPLTARVTVNRIWQAYFGKGIVETESDFGLQGDKPTHPELLDYLAVEFMDRGWSQKALHRLIVTSNVYRQSSTVRPDLKAADPENRLLARQNRLRLEAEIVRDASLSVSGLLAPRIGGPSVYPPQPAGVYQVTQVRREWKTSTGEDRYRRGLYTFFQRSAPHPSLALFDAPDSAATCTKRFRSNTPLQALTQLNDEAATEFATSLAKRVAQDSDTDVNRINRAYFLALSREARPAELSRTQRFLNEQRANKVDPWPALARLLINLDEFLTRP